MSERACESGEMREGGRREKERRKGKAISGQQVSLSPGINSASMGGTHASDKSGTSLRDRLLIALSLSENIQRRRLDDVKTKTPNQIHYLRETNFVRFCAFTYSRLCRSFTT